ncbi:hypothetical protein AruPA_17795, partial [Acidiphilium sp. PA]|uniref:hypothetical protein n=1 Tax=Acidiphilium sp. PA TaxID=2871705 RepID=UPI0022434121
MVILLAGKLPPNDANGIGFFRGCALFFSDDQFVEDHVDPFETFLTTGNVELDQIVTMDDDVARAVPHLAQCH